MIGASPVGKIYVYRIGNPTSSATLRRPYELVRHRNWKTDSGGETIDNFLKFVQRARIKHSSIYSYIIPHTDLHEQLKCIL